MKVIHDNISRRRFLSNAFMSFGLLFGLGTLFVRFFQFLIPEVKPGEFQEILVGFEADIPADGLGIEVAGQKLYLLKNDEGIVAFSRRCTDLGCLISWNKSQKKFICPCHNGIFDANGKNISGPPPRPLDRFEVKKRGKHIYVKVRRA